MANPDHQGFDSRPVPQPRLLLTEADLYRRYGIQPRTAQKWRLVGDGPRFIKLGRLVRYDLADVEAWLEGRKRRSTSDPGPKAA